MKILKTFPQLEVAKLKIDSSFFLRQNSQLLWPLISSHGLMVCQVPTASAVRRQATLRVFAAVSNSGKGDMTEQRIRTAVLQSECHFDSSKSTPRHRFCGKFWIKRKWNKKTYERERWWAVRNDASRLCGPWTKRTRTVRITWSHKYVGRILGLQWPCYACSCDLALARVVMSWHHIDHHGHRLTSIIMFLCWHRATDPHTWRSASLQRSISTVRGRTSEGRCRRTANWTTLTVTINWRETPGAIILLCLSSFFLFLREEVNGEA